MGNLRVVFALLPLFGACAADNSLQATLARMDGAATKYRGMKANITKAMYLEAIKQSDVESGTIAARRSSPKDLRMLITITEPNPKKYLFGGAKAEIYYPKMNSVEEYDVSKAGSMKDQLLMLSFGSTSKELANTYAVTVGSPETVAGQKTTRLDLVPKDKKLFSQYPRMQIWIADETGITVQQRVFERGGDYTQATYSNIDLANVTEADVKLDIPPNAKREKPLNR